MSLAPSPEIATMQGRTTEPLFAGGTVDVDRLNGHKLRIDLSTEEARARLLTDAGRQELNGAARMPYLLPS